MEEKGESSISPALVVRKSLFSLPRIREFILIFRVCITEKNFTKKGKGVNAKLKISLLLFMCHVPFSFSTLGESLPFPPSMYSGLLLLLLLLFYVAITKSFIFSLCRDNQDVSVDSSVEI